MIFRKTRPEELQDVVAIIEQARARIAQLGIDQWQSGYPDAGAISADIAREVSYVVEDSSGCICATCMVDYAGEPMYDIVVDGAWLTGSDSDAPDYLVAHRVAVGDAGLRRGMARFMLGEVERMAAEQGYSSVRIDTHEGNVPMRKLLASSGYTDCGIVMLPDESEPTRERIAFEKLVD